MSTRHVNVSLTLAFSALLGCTAIPSFAAPKPVISLAQAQKTAQEKESGTVKSHELEQEKGRWIYSLDILRDGKVHEVNVDANTGKVVEDQVETAADEAQEQQKDKAAARR